MKIRTLLSAVAITTLAPLGVWAGPVAGPSGYTATDALDLLMAGNVRYSSGMPEHRNSGTDRIAETAAGQSPFAVVLTCADSRVPAELVFDRGVGDIFVVRVAGNTSGTFQAGSIEYAIEHLGSPLIVVMGHTSCGAVKAVASGGEAHGNIGAMLQPIGPAVTEARASSPDAGPDDLTNIAVRCNVMHSISDLISSSPSIASMVGEQKVRLVGAVYDIGTGRVEWLGQHPQQGDIIARAASNHGENAAGAEHASGASEEPATIVQTGKTASTSAQKSPSKVAAKPGATPAPAKPASHANAEDEHH